MESLPYKPQIRKEAELFAQEIVETVVRRGIFHLTTNEMEFLTKRRLLMDLREPINSFAFRMMSYNLLSDSLSEATTRQFKEFDAKYLDWKYRAKLIQKEIAFYSPDILCLQEIDKADTILLPSLESEYEAKIKFKTGDRSDGLATLYKKDKFNLIEHKYLEFKDTHPSVAKEHVAQLVVLSMKPTIEGLDNKLLIIANLHTLFNEKRGDIKVTQIYLTMRALEELSLKYKQYDRMVFFAGDFNLIPNSGLYTWISKGTFNFSDVKNNLLSGQREGTWNKFKAYNDLNEFITYLTNHYEYNKKNAESKLTPIKGWIQILRETKLVFDDEEKIKIVYVEESKTDEVNKTGEQDKTGEKDKTVEESPFDFTIKVPLQMTSAYAWFKRYLVEDYGQLKSKMDLPPSNSTYECSMTHCSVNGPLTVDYIWFMEIPASIESYKRLRVARIVEIPQLEDLEKISRKFPQKFFPSDHFSLIVDFTFDTIK